MRKFLILNIVFFCLVAGSFAKSKPLYELPETVPSKSVSEEDKVSFLVGTDKGLYNVKPNGSSVLIWNGSKVNRILKTSSKWFFVTSDKGIVVSSDLKDFSESNQGLPVLTIKEYDGTTKTFVKRVHPLKDISVDPIDENNMVTATKDAVYLSRDGGATWKSIGSTSKYTAGMKAVAVAHMPIYANDGTVTGTETVVFQSHPIYGFSYYRADAANPAWVDLSAGLAIMPSLTQVDEISDILAVPVKNEDGTSTYCDVYCAQSFLPNIYKFDWKARRAKQIYHGKEAVDSIDALYYAGDSIYFNMLGKVTSLSLSDYTLKDLPNPEYATWRTMVNSPDSIVNAAYVPASYTGINEALLVNELWMMTSSEVLSPYGKEANDRKAIYIQPYMVCSDAGMAKYKKIITDNKLNAVVIDMKDDYGTLHFKNPQSPLLKEKGTVSAYYTVDLEKFIADYKAAGIYMIARIPVFKDKCLSKYNSNKYAVWNANTKGPWIGTKSNGEYYDEYWVDPYSQEVWEYTVEIAKEMIDRGFDEINFDYIRFPTDGTNMGSASYRWRDEGMDKESAITSFLMYARKNIDAPISIDIYGANGWYRSGTRTGQDVEMLSEYSDIICPMYYPSHFEQDFLEYSPVVERPYRVYFYGSFRNSVIGRNRIIVRPWVQAFYLGVRYDRAYYNADYVKREVYGVRDGLNRGYMYWNNSGRYDDICVDPGDSKSPWYENEGALQERKPAFSPIDPTTYKKVVDGDAVSAEKAHNDDMLEVWNTVLAQASEEETSVDEQAESKDTKKKEKKSKKSSAKENRQPDSSESVASK